MHPALGRYDARFVVTDPPNGSLERIAADAAPPPRFVVGCFFRSPDQRKAFLEGLKRTAALAAIPDRAADLVRDAAMDDATDAGWLRRIVRTRAQAGLGYHVYSLRAGVPPYAAGCLISFEPLEPPALARHADLAREETEVQRRRMLDVFGLRTDDAAD
jgi:hypothetical protein